MLIVADKDYTTAKLKNPPPDKILSRTRFPSIIGQPPTSIYMAGNETLDNTNIDTMQIGNTTFKIASFYDGEVTLLDILKSALRRDAQAVLRQINNPVESGETT